MLKFLLCTGGYEWEWYAVNETNLPETELFTYEVKESQYSRKHVDIQYINTHGEYYERVEVLRYEPTWEEWCTEGQYHQKEEETEDGDVLFSRVIVESGWIKSFDTWEQVQAFMKEKDATAIVPTDYTFSDGSLLFGLVL